MSAPSMQWRKDAARQLRAVARVLRPITSFEGFAGLRIVAQTLSASWPYVRAVLVLFCWWCAIFVLAGLPSFAGRLGLRCALCEDAACTRAQLGSAVSPELPCGSARDARACPAPLTCLPARDDALVAWASFDNFAWAALSVLRVSLAGGWWDVLSALSAGVGRAAGVLFCLPLLVGALHLLIPLLTALLAEQFGVAWRQHARGAEEEYAELKEALHARLTAAGKSLLAALRLNAGEEGDDDKKDSAAGPLSHYLNSLRGVLGSALESHHTRSVLALAHGANLVAMALVFPDMAGLRPVVQGVNIAATAVFAAESAAQCVLLGPVEFCASWPRVLDGAITLAAVIGLLPRPGGPRYGASVLRTLCLIAATLRAEPLPWLAPRLRHDPSLRRLVDALAHALLTQKELLAVAAAHVLTTAIGGSLFFSRASPADAGAELAAATSFSSFGEALLTSFAMMTGANAWQLAMWHAMRVTSAGAAIFFVLQQMGSVLLMCLFNAALVRSFAVREDAEQVSEEQLDDAAAKHETDLAVDPLAEVVDERVKVVRRHAAAREVDGMRSWLQAQGRIRGLTGHESDDEDGVADEDDTLAARVKRRRERREAHKAWVQPVAVTALDGKRVMDAGCDGYMPGDAASRAPDPGCTPLGLRFLVEGVDVPVQLEEAYDRRRAQTGLLRGRCALLRQRRRMNALAERIEAGEDIDSGSDGENEDAAASGSDISEDESPPVENNMVVASRRSAAQQKAADPRSGGVAGALPPVWLAAGLAPARLAGDMFNAPGRNAQERARATVAHAQGRALARAALPNPLCTRAAVLPVCDDSELWAPCADDLPLPLLPDAKRRSATTPGRDGMPRACLVIDTEHLPIVHSRDVTERRLTPLLAGPLDCSFMQHTSLWLFPPDSTLRRLLFLLSLDSRFQLLCAAFTLVAVAVFAAERPDADPRGPQATAISYVDMMLNVLFAYELGIKLVVRGMALHPGSLLRQPYGWFESAAFVGGLWGTLGPPSGLRALRSLRLFALLPLLRKGPAAQPLALVLTALERALPTLQRLLYLGAAGLLVFSVAAAALLTGRGARCADALAPDAQPPACAGLFVDAAGVAQQRARLTPVLHFDDLPHAALSLFTLSTLDEWPALVRPFTTDDGATGLLFAAWIAVAVLLWRNLVTAAVVDAYVRVSMGLQGRQPGDEASYRDWAAAFRMRRQQAARGRTAGAAGTALSAPRRAADAIVSHPRFEPVMCAAVGVNILFVAIEGVAGDSLQRGTEIAFSALFMLELSLVMLAHGPATFWSSPRNRVDLAITLSSVLVLISGLRAFNINVLRLLRLERVLRLFPHLRRVQLLLQVLLASLPGLSAVSLLTTLMLVVYSIMGMALFGSFVPGMAAAAPPTKSIDFTSFGMAILSMFRIFTLDGWTSAMQQLMRCEGVEYLFDGTTAFAQRCAFSPAPPLFLISFALICTFLTCALATAVVFDALRRCTDEFGVVCDFGETLTRLAVLNRVVARFMAPVHRTRALRASLEEDHVVTWHRKQLQQQGVQAAAPQRTQ